VSFDDLLARIRDKAILMTEEKIRNAKNDTTMMLIMILSEVYSLEFLIEELLRTLDRLAKISLQKKT